MATDGLLTGALLEFLFDLRLPRGSSSIRMQVPERLTALMSP